MRAVAEQADDRLMLALDDLHHAPFGAAIGATPFDARENMIAIHRVAQIVAADKEIAVNPGNRLIRHEKSVPIAMRDDTSSDQIWVACSLGRRRGSGRVGGFGFGFGSAGGATRSGIRRTLLLSETKTSAIDFFDVAASLKLLENPRKETAAAMIQVHAVGDPADARGLGQGREISNYLCAGDVRFVRFFLSRLCAGVSWAC